MKKNGKTPRELLHFVLLSRPTWAFRINRGTSWMSFLQNVLFPTQRRFLCRSVINGMVFKAFAAETLNKCSRIVGSFKRQGLLQGILPSISSLCKPSPLIEAVSLLPLLISLLSSRRSCVRRRIPLNDYCRITRVIIFREINVCTWVCS